ncbi:MAG TPA: DUSAM domain-containing protein [Hyalangium sp.]|jgi:DUSAM domain-containing protein|nr:DUSAM domain-containing protein [Hyalangium sp.]
MEENEPDWDPIRVLARRVLELDEALELSDETRACLHSGAREVGISPEDVEAALRSVTTATTLLREISRRMEDGEKRLSDASFRVYRLRDAGDLEGAREEIQKVLAVEVVPLYREHAQKVLSHLDRLQMVAASGHADPHLPEASQVPILLRRVQHGHALELNDGMRAFLRRATADVGMSEIEAEEALARPESAAELLGRIMGRLRDASDRLKGATARMMDLRDAGDLEGARQQIRDWLAVEAVPRFRRAAEEQLAHLDELPPAP